MVARATAPDKIGPTSVFPNSGFWDFQQGLQGKFESIILNNTILIIYFLYQGARWLRRHSG